MCCWRGDGGVGVSPKPPERRSSTTIVLCWLCVGLVWYCGGTVFALFLVGVLSDEIRFISRISTINHAMPRKSILVRIRTNGAVIDVYDPEVAKVLINMILSGKSVNAEFVAETPVAGEEPAEETTSVASTAPLEATSQTIAPNTEEEPTEKVEAAPEPTQKQASYYNRLLRDLERLTGYSKKDLENRVKILLGVDRSKPLDKRSISEAIEMLKQWRESAIHALDPYVYYDGDSKRYVCAKCGAEFKSITAAAEHLRNKHNIVPSFEK